jgi:predicted AlkP superfamily phosphohydrolase/phosphomutase
VYVNLKGRDPEGIVEPEDYEKVQQEIMDALLTYRDPETGKRPVALALSKQDARILGLYGDRIGDVIYAINPWFGSQHGQILPTAEYGACSLKALLVFNGPGIKKGHRLQRTVWLTDIVPTICYLLDMPVPEHAEGAIIYQALKDPDANLKELKKLQDALARMETAYTRKNREPWDHHDCA